MARGWHFNSEVGSSKTKRKKKLLTNSYFSVTVGWLKRGTTPASEKRALVQHRNTTAFPYTAYGDYKKSDACFRCVFWMRSIAADNFKHPNHHKKKVVYSKSSQRQDLFPIIVFFFFKKNCIIETTQLYLREDFACIQINNSSQNNFLRTER